MDRRILHVDCDAFFVQAARLADPEGAGREPLLLVGGRADGRGVVASCSYETRAFGVRSAMPTGHALRLCPAARVVPVPREMVSRKSREVRAVLERWAPVVEMASVDEAYLDLSGTERLYRDEPLERTALRVQADVRERTEIDVSLGGGSNRLVAKLATTLAKPRGVHVVPPGSEARFVAGHEIGDIPGVGPAFVESLRRRGVLTMSALLQVDRGTLRSWLGDGRGDWLHARIRAIDPSPIGRETGARSISSERTFPRDLQEDAEIGRALLALVEDVGASLRSAALRARTVTVKIRDPHFRDRSHGRTLAQGVETDRALHELARALLQRLRSESRTPVRLLSVALSNLEGEGAVQALLTGFADPLESEREIRLTRTVDRLRERFGRGAIRAARLVAPPEGPDREDPDGRGASGRSGVSGDG